MSRDYYRTIDGHKYDAKMIELAEQAVAGQGDGRISLEDARLLLESVQDANRYTDTEKATMRYIRDHFRFTPAADHWFRTEIRKWAGVRSHTMSAGAHAEPVDAAADAAPPPVADAPAAAVHPALPRAEADAVPVPEPAVPAPAFATASPVREPPAPAAPAPSERSPSLPAAVAPPARTAPHPVLPQAVPPERAASGRRAARRSGWGLRLGLVAGVLLVALAGLVLLARRPAAPPSTHPVAGAPPAPAVTSADPVAAAPAAPTDTATPPEAPPAAPTSVPPVAGQPVASPPPAVAGGEPASTPLAPAPAPSPVVAASAPAGVVPAAPAAPAAAGGSYTVQAGDSLWRIAARRYGDPTLWPLVYQENRDRIRHPDRIRPGMELAVPALAADGGVERARIAEAYLAAYEAYHAAEQPDAADYLAAARRLDPQVTARHEQRPAQPRVQASR